MIPISKPAFTQSEINAVTKVMQSGHIAQGEKVKELEEKFARYCGTKYAVAFNSGTAAIHSALYALGIKPGDEVITTPFTFVASANPILMLQARPVFADISEDDFNINPDEVRKKITARTKVIIPVDLYGLIYDVEKIGDIAKRNHIKILEDACQSIGASYKKGRSGSFGDVAAFSLYATKNITCGEGGMITTNNSHIAEKCRMFRHHGQSETKRYEYFDLGYNYRMTDLAAAIAIEQLKRIEKIKRIRRRNANLLLIGLKNIRGLILPVIKTNKEHAFHQFTIRITDSFASSREGFLNYLHEKHIGYGIYYPKPLHLFSLYAKLGYKKGDFPVAEKLSEEVVSLPVHPELRIKDIDYIIDTIQKYAKT